MKRVLYLDALRLFAVLLVLTRHIDLIIFITPYPNKELFSFFSFFLQVGWSGVDLFFVISGFLISGLLFNDFKKNNTIDLKRFFIRRGFKIYPSFYFMLIVCALAQHFLVGNVNVGLLLNDAFFIQNYLPSMWGHTWSLAVEEHFYIFMTILSYYLIRKKQFLNIKYVCIAIMITCLVGRILSQVFLGQVSYSASHFRFDSLMFGVLLSYLCIFENKYIDWVQRMNFFSIFFVAAILLSPIVFLKIESNAYLNTIGYSIVYIAYGLIVIKCAYLPIESSAAHGPLIRTMAYLGARSYSIYLWHFPARSIVDMLDGNFGPFYPSLWVLLYFGFSFGLGLLFYKLVELPFLKIRDRFVL